MSTGAIGGASSASAASAANPFASMSPQDFVQVMLSELQNQDPMNPEDSTDILNQLSSLQNIDSQMQLQSQLQSLVSQNSLASASGLIGKMVTGLDGSGNTLSGTVNAVDVQNGAPVLNLDSGQTLAFSQVTQIAPAPTAATTTGTTTTPATTGTTTTTP